MNRWCILPILCSFALSLAVSAEGEPATLILTDDVEDIGVGKYLAVLPDSVGERTIDDINSTDLRHRFIDSGVESLFIGQFVKATWSRFTLQNESKRNRWILEMRPNGSYQLEVYWRDDPASEWTVQRAGDLIPSRVQEIEHRHYSVPIELEPGKRRDYFVRVAPDVFLMSQHLYSERSFAQHVRRENLALGAYYGLIFGLAVYHLVLFITLRDRAYLYYVLMVAAGALYFLGFNGIGQEYLWPETTISFDRYMVVFNSVYVVCILRFVQAYLLTKQHAPGIHRIVSWLVAIAFLFPLASLAGFHELALLLQYMVYNWSIWVIISVAGVTTLRRGFVPARYFLIAWAGYVLGAFIVLSIAIGIIPFSILAWNAFQIGQALEIILLSLAMGNRISTLRRSKEAQDRELDTARRLQMELLPDSPPAVGGLDIAGRCIPAGHVGGDMYPRLLL